MSYVTLTSEDLEALIDVTQHVVDYKQIALSVSRWQTFESEYLPKLVQQLGNNQFRCFRTDDNTFTWLADQIRHCRLVQPGVKRENWPSLDSVPLVQRVLDICAAASGGQARYNLSRHRANFSNWFED